MKILRRSKGTKAATGVSGTKWITIVGVAAMITLLADMIVNPQPFPSRIPWQLIAFFLALTISGFLASGVYIFKAKSPVITGTDFHNSLDSTDPVGSATIVTHKRSIVMDIFAPGGFRAFKFYNPGGGTNGFALIPRYLWHKDGGTIHADAYWIKWPFHALPPSVQGEFLKLKHLGFNEETTPIYWFIGIKEASRYTIKIHSKDTVELQVYDILHMLQVSGTQYDDLAERMGSMRHVMKIEDRSYRRGKAPRLKEPENDTYE